MVMRRIELGVVALLLVAQPAAGARLDLTWGRCAPAGGEAHRYFTCSGNEGANVLVASFATDRDHPDFDSLAAYIDIAGTPMPLPDWWQLANEGSCRAHALSLATTFGDLPGMQCADPWAGAARGGITYFATQAYPPPLPWPVPAVNRADLRISFTRATPMPLTAGTEYYAFTLTISDEKSTGQDSCGGCSAGVCLFLKELVVSGPSGSEVLDDWVVDGSRTATWQCADGVIENDPFSPPVDFCEAIAGCALAVHNRTWGQLKSLYR